MKKLINPLLVIFIAVILRLVPHPANFAPIAAMALFGGAYLDKKYALIIPLTALFVSDIFLGFHNTMIFVYGSFLLTGLTGIWIKKRKNFSRIFMASIFSSLLFYLITNFGVWFLTPLYPKTLLGLLESYVMAIPFFRNTVSGDLFYTVLLLGGYEFLIKFAKKTMITRNSFFKKPF